MSKKRQKKEKYQSNGPNGNIHIQPLNKRQQELIDSIYDSEMVITTGYAGTGKTYIPTRIAAKEFKKGNIDKIILARPNTPAGRRLGFLPGDEQEKLNPWFVEIFKLLEQDLGGKNALDASIRNGSIKTVAFETMRGQTFDDAFVILDEAQNTEVDEMKMFVTRLGDNTTVVANGDIFQSDLNKRSGLSTIIEIITECEMDIPIIDFKQEDIVRSGICKKWIVNWMAWESEHKHKDGS